MTYFFLVMFYALGFAITTLVCKYTDHFNLEYRHRKFKDDEWMAIFFWPVYAPILLFIRAWQWSIRRWDEVSDRIVEEYKKAFDGEE